MIVENEDFFMKSGVNCISFLYDTFILALVPDGNTILKKIKFFFEIVTQLTNLPKCTYMIKNIKILFKKLIFIVKLLVYIT